MRKAARHIDLTTKVGSLQLPNPVMTASGASGHGRELSAYGDLSELGAMVVKSLTVVAWPGNPAPRVHEVAGGMINSVGLEGPGIRRWLEEELPRLLALRARVVVSIWGRTVEDFAETARLLAKGAADAGALESGVRDGAGGGRAGSVLPRGGIAALEVNMSCPNIEDRSKMFAHDPSAAAAVVSAVDSAVNSALGNAKAGHRLPLWAKLSPNVTDIREVALASRHAGAEGLTLVNTLLGLSLDVERRRPLLGAGGGGLSGPPLRPVALRAVWECRQALPDSAIIGVGGIRRGVDAVEMLMAGADAVQVGTAIFRNPKAPWQVLRELRQWCKKHGIPAASRLRAAAVSDLEDTDCQGSRT